jgi:hypothetical protein
MRPPRRETAALAFGAIVGGHSTTSWTGWPMDAERSTVKARTLGQLGSLVQNGRTYAPNRPCEKPGCITILTRCNPGPYCRRHTGARDDDETTSNPENW